MAREKSAISKAEQRIVKAQSLSNKPIFEDKNDWLNEITKQNKLLNDLKTDLKNKYIPPGTKKKTERALKRVEGWIKKHSNPPKEEFSEKEIEKEISKEEITVSETEMKITTEDKIVEVVEVVGVAPDKMPEESMEEVKESPELIRSAIEDMCYRIGHNDWVDVTIKVVEVLRSEDILKNNDEIKNFLHRLELKLAI